MKPVIVLPPSATHDEVKSCREAGYVVVKSRNPDKVCIRAPVPNLELTGNDLLLSALRALNLGDQHIDDQRRTVFFRHLQQAIEKRLAPKVVVESAGGDR